MSEHEIGHVTHWFGRIGVAAIDITEGSLAVGDKIHIVGHTSDFTHSVESMEVQHQPVQMAMVGESVGAKVCEHAREHDIVYRIDD